MLLSILRRPRLAVRHVQALDRPAPGRWSGDGGRRRRPYCRTRCIPSNSGASRWTDKRISVRIRRERRRGSLAGAGRPALEALRPAGRAGCGEAARPAMAGRAAARPLRGGSCSERSRNGQDCNGQDCNGQDCNGRSRNEQSRNDQGRNEQSRNEQSRNGQSRNGHAGPVRQGRGRGQAAMPGGAVRARPARVGQVRPCGR